MIPFRFSLLLSLCLAWTAMAQQAAPLQPPDCAVRLHHRHRLPTATNADQSFFLAHLPLRRLQDRPLRFLGPTLHLHKPTIPGKRHSMRHSLLYHPTSTWYVHHLVSSFHRPSTHTCIAAKNASMTACGAKVRSHGQDYILLSNVMIVIAAAFVAVRFAFKLIVARLDIGYDDWSVLATLIAASPSAVITVFGTVKNGLGRDIWTLTPYQITTMLKYFYVMASLYFTQVALLKLSLIFFYIRVFPAPGVQRVLWGTVIFSVLWGFISVIIVIFQCQPISYFWTHWDGLHKGKCLNINAITTSNAAISIILDLWILGIPLWQLWGLQLHWKRKVGVALMFCVGTFVTVVSMLRLQALVTFARSANASWEFYNVSVWSTIEICVGIMW
jgi:hypothetical protein